MQVAIIGSRDFPELDRVRRFVAGLARKHPDAVVVSGGARGVDRAAELAAAEHGLPFVSFRPCPGVVSGTFELERVLSSDDGETRVRYGGVFGSFGRAAFARNEDIAREADVVVAFTTGSRGTASTLEHAARLGRDTWVYTPTNGRSS